MKLQFAMSNNENNRKKMSEKIKLIKSQIFTTIISQLWHEQQTLNEEFVIYRV